METMEGKKDELSTGRAPPYYMDDIRNLDSGHRRLDRGEEKAILWDAMIHAS